MIQAPADSLAAVLDAVFAAPKYDWVQRVHPMHWIRDHLDKLLGWFEGLALTAPTVYWGVVVMAVVVLVAILVHAGWLVARTIRRSSAPDALETPRGSVRRDGSWYRREASRLAGSGRYPEAMRAYFEGMVLDLSAAGAVRWHPSKTPREYAHEAKLPTDDRVRLAALVDGVYAASFAGREFGAAEWQAWRDEAAGAWRAP